MSGEIVYRRSRIKYIYRNYFYNILYLKYGSHIFTKYTSTELIVKVLFLILQVENAAKDMQLWS